MSDSKDEQAVKEEAAERRPTRVSEEANGKEAIAPKRLKVELFDTFIERFTRLATLQDGFGLYRLLEDFYREPIDSDHTISFKSGDATASSLALGRKLGQTEKGLEAILGAFKSWATRYETAEGRASWMLPPMVWLASRSRHLAKALDVEGKDMKYRERLVELFRARFQKLHRDPVRREGCLAVSCELLRLYFGVGQAAQCPFLIAALVQARNAKSGMSELNSLPKALSVALCFYWGKHCVLDGNVIEADEKLSWALKHCPRKAVGNRRLILTYLVPCKLRLGFYPAAASKAEMAPFAKLARAVAKGDVRAFAKELDAQESALIDAGTFLVVEKLRLLCYRNLCSQVHKIVSASIEKADAKHKHDLKPYQVAFAWQDGLDPDESICVLANLMYIGAIRGYMSDEHQKIVFSKDMPFPPPAVWSPKA